MAKITSSLLIVALLFSVQCAATNPLNNWNDDDSFPSPPSPPSHSTPIAIPPPAPPSSTPKVLSKPSSPSSRSQVTNHNINPLNNWNDDDSTPTPPSKPSNSPPNRIPRISTPSLQPLLPPPPIPQSFSYTHAPLFPISGSTYLAFTLSTLGLLLSSIGGIGGGGILVPIYILILEFDTKHAIPLSNVTVLGGAIANCIVYSNQRHPSKLKVDRPLVDWDLVLVMEPLTIAGALVGAFLNVWLPEVILAVGLVGLLGVVAWGTVGKALKMYEKESLEIGSREDGGKRIMRSVVGKEIRAKKRLVGGEEEGGEGGVEVEVELVNIYNPKPEHSAIEVKGDDAIPEITGGDENEDVDKHELDDDDDDDDDEERTSLLSTQPSTKPTQTHTSRTRTQPPSLTLTLNDVKAQESTAPFHTILTLTKLFTLITLLNILKGGTSSLSPAGVQCGSTAFWAINVGMVVYCFYVMHYARQHLIARYELKKKLNYRYLAGDIKWTSSNTLLYPSICILAGLFAGIFGIGGGIIKGPLMIHMGVNPSVSSATCSMLIMFTSITACSSYFAFGLIVPDYAAICFIIGFCATYTGQTMFARIVKKNERFNRGSLIAFCIGVVVGVSAVFMGVEAMVEIYNGKGEEGVRVGERKGVCN